MGQRTLAQVCTSLTRFYHRNSYFLVRPLCATGTAVGGAGGNVYVTVGSGDTGNGGALVLSAGTTNAGAGSGSGGLVTIKTGYSSTASSGNLLLQTENAGVPYLVPSASAISGFIVMSTGTASAGNSGSIFIGSGKNVGLFCYLLFHFTGRHSSCTLGVVSSGRGGAIYINVGSGTR